MMMMTATTTSTSNAAARSDRSSTNRARRPSLLLMPPLRRRNTNSSKALSNDDNVNNEEDEEEEDDDDIESLAALERNLALQISLENYAEAAKLRDRIANMKRDDLIGVETCNALFYDCFRRGDFEKMWKDVWGVGAHVRCTHPGMPTVLGDENVKESWRIVFESMAGGGSGGSSNSGESSTSSQQKMDVRCKNVEAYASGNLGIVTCEEVVMRASTLTCTNVFEKQGGEWKMIQHHASAIFPGSVGAGGSSASSSSSSSS